MTEKVNEESGKRGQQGNATVRVLKRTLRSTVYSLPVLVLAIILGLVIFGATDALLNGPAALQDSSYGAFAFLALWFGAPILVIVVGGYHAAIEVIEDA